VLTSCVGRSTRQALTAYEQLRLDDEHYDDDTTSRTVVAPHDDIGTTSADYVGLMQRVRKHCRQYSDLIQLALHRETMYQGQSVIDCL